MSCEESKNVVYICKIDFAKKQGFYKKKNWKFWLSRFRWIRQIEIRTFILLKVSKNRNDFMKTSFLLKTNKLFEYVIQIYIYIYLNHFGFYWPLLSGSGKNGYLQGKKYKRDGGLFATQSFTNSTLNEPSRCDSLKIFGEPMDIFLDNLFDKHCRIPRQCRHLLILVASIGLSDLFRTALYIPCFLKVFERSLSHFSGEKT